MLWILTLVAGIWSLSRIADSDYQQAGALLAAAAVFAVAGLLFGERP